MDKKLILEQLINKVKDEQSKLEQAYNSSSAFKSEGDMKQEGKYDTRAIEAGYLAGAQLKRIEELKLELQMLEELPIRDLGNEDVVSLGALIELELNDRTQKYFICSTAGGTLLEVEGMALLVISVFSPIGDAALGLKLDDSFEIKTPKGTKEYTIKSIS